MEDLLSKLGPWHLPSFAFCLLRGFPASQFVMSLSFLAPKQDHFCARPQAFKNWTVEQWKTFAIPQETDKTSGEIVFSHCKMYNVTEFAVNNDTTVPCTSWEYDSSFHKRSVINEWDVVCDDVWLLALSQSILMMGFMIGNLVFSHLSDWFGRRNALLACTLLSGSSTVLIIFSNSFIMYNIFRFLAFLGHGGFQNVTYTLGIECVSPKHRAVISMLQQFGWIFGFIVLPGLAYLITQWRYLHLAMSVSFIGMLAAWYFLDESPRWLMSRRRYSEARQIVTNIITKNKLPHKDCDEIIAKAKRRIEQEDLMKKSTALDLFKSYKMTILTVALYVMMAINGMLYYNFMYLIVDIGGNKYLNFFLVSLLELPVMATTAIVISYVRRRLAYALLYSIITLVCLGIIVVPERAWWIHLIFVVIGKLAIHTAYGNLCVHVTESFPTVVRAVALGTGLTANRIGPVISPFVKELGRVSHWWVPRALDIVVCILSILLSLMLPETLRKSLPDTFKETLTKDKLNENEIQLRETAKALMDEEEL